MKNIFKITFFLIILVDILMAEKLYKFDDLYYIGLVDKMSAWQPVGNNQKSVVQITVDKFGKFDYLVKKKAESEEFNKSLIKFLDEQKQFRYPVNRDRFIKIFVDFKSEQ